MLAHAALLGCAGRGSDTGTDSEALKLSPVADPIQLAPNQAAQVAFRLRNGAMAVPGRTVSFAIVAGDPGAQGATLTASTAVTDAEGVAAVGVRAGLATEFRVQAQIGASPAQVTVFVRAGTSGTVAVAPFFTAGSSAAQQRTSSIRVLLYEQTSCAALDPENLSPPFRNPETLAIGDSTVSFPYVSTASNSAVFVQAVGPGPTIVATGCADVLGASLLPSGSVQVPVPLVEVVPDPVGTFAVTTTLAFAPPLAAAAAIAAPWAQLSDCPLDPAQLWLDCTADALSTSAGDPLDCVPAAAAGGEGQLGDALAAGRGAWLVDGAGTRLTCRGARDGSGNESLDAIVQGLFGSPAPPALVALPAIAADAASILDSVRLASNLVIAPATQPGTYVLTHTLQAALFGPAWMEPALLAPLGLPVLQTVTSATVSGTTLNIARHGFTLRLGSAARAAFGPLALAPRGFPANVTGFVSALFAQARGPGAISGCNALDAKVCPAVGRPTGCLVDACGAGLTALAGLLDGAFAAADGMGLDLTLAGTAPLVPLPGSLRARSLGVDTVQSSTGAVWSATLDTAAGSTTISATFEGVRD